MEFVQATMRGDDRVGGRSREEYDFEEQVGYLLRRAYQRNIAIFQRLCADPNLTSVQFAVLCVLVKYGPSSQSDIGRFAAIDPSTTKGVVDRLKDRGLVELSDAKEDKRKNIVKITREGLAMFDRMGRIGLDITETTLRPLNPAERIALVYLLKKISDLSVDDLGSQ